MVNQVHKSASHLHTYDNLDRLRDTKIGVINGSQSGIQSHWQINKQV